MRHWIRCSICRRRFGRHDPFVIHGDGKTDDTLALQAIIDRGGPIPPGGPYVVGGPGPLVFPPSYQPESEGDPDEPSDGRDLRGGRLL